MASIHREISSRRPDDWDAPRRRRDPQAPAPGFVTNVQMEDGAW
jgi:hypothetical protein